MQGGAAAASEGCECVWMVRSDERGVRRGRFRIYPRPRLRLRRLVDQVAVLLDPRRVAVEVLFEPEEVWGRGPRKRGEGLFCRLRRG